MRRPYKQRSAIVLIIVLVTIVAISLSAYTFSSLMLTHRLATKLSGQQLQARMLVESGVESVKLYFMQDEATRTEMGGHFDNPLMFQGLSVIPEQDLQSRGSFTVISPSNEDETGVGIRYGLEDESTRLNLNLLLLADKAIPDSGRTLLMGVPGMTEDVADAILDWIDEDEEPREYGAELEYYAALSPPYEPKNGPLTTVEELLLVRGVTPSLLFGIDQNRNGIADMHELNGAQASIVDPMATSTATMADGSLSHRGWSAYLTLYSAEKNTNIDGLPRINLNQDDLQALYDELIQVFSEEWVTFIIGYRLYGPYDGDENGQPAEAMELDLTQEPQAKLTQVLDLIGAKVQMGEGGGNSGGGGGGRGGGGGNEPPVMNSPFSADIGEMADYLPVLMDNCTVSDSPLIPGRVNINAAPAEILLGIPGMNEDIVNGILEIRALLTEGDPSYSNEYWLMTNALVTVEEMRTLLPFVCAGGDVFRAQVIGYYQGGGPSSRVEVVFDATGQEPRVVLWRDISHLGRGYSLEMLGVDLTSF